MTDDAAELWTASELVPAVHGVPSGTISGPITGVSIDTRSLRPGDLFVALSGPDRDGHQFVEAALAAGAAAALVTHEPAGLPAHAPLIRVDDTLTGLERLGDAARRRSDARVIAVTGSVGKTGTKEMLAAALAAQARTHWSAASYNNHWGVPLSLARLPREARYAVLELGMNHAGEIAALTRLARPHVAVITTVEPAHLEFFPNIEAIADAKAEIFLGMGGAGTAILNHDNPQFGRLCAAAEARGLQNIVRFGSDEAADWRLLDVTPNDSGSDILAVHGERQMAYRLAQHGRHVALNSLAVLAAVAAVDADVGQAAAALGRVASLAGRGRRQSIALRDGTAILIDESYNASPASMRAALAVLADARPSPGGRRLAVLGDMRELGSQAAELHRALLPDLAAADPAHLFCCGPLMWHLAEAAAAAGITVTHTESAAALAPAVIRFVRPGDIVLVKGSLGSRMADIVRPLLASHREGAVAAC